MDDFLGAFLVRKGKTDDVNLINYKQLDIVEDVK
jgi:hypothetical protein